MTELHCDIPQTYSESARGLRISRSRALRELSDHGVFHPEDMDEFFLVCGDRKFYDAETVLCWLGY